MSEKIVTPNEEGIKGQIRELVRGSVLLENQTKKEYDIGSAVAKDAFHSPSQSVALPKTRVGFE